MSWPGLFASDDVVSVGVPTLLAVLITVHGLRRVGATRAARLLAGAALGLALAGALALTLRPGSGAPPWSRLILDPVLGASDGHGRTVWGPLLANVVLFVPLGALAAARFPGRAGRVWLVLALLSLTIEACQYLLPIDRIANTADVLANATGAGLGVVVDGVVRRLAGGPGPAPGDGRRPVVTGRRRA